MILLLKQNELKVLLNCAYLFIKKNNHRILINKALFYLKVSRPGLWFATIWLYLLPTSGQEELLSTFGFWFGLFYVCFPLCFMVYGWNDVVDFETDKLNPRKDSFWFGARGSKEQLDTLWKPILMVQLITVPIMVYLGGWEMLLVFGLFFLINGLYNKRENGLRSRPPLELLCQIGYLLIVPMSIFINNTGSMPWQSYLYLFLFSMQSHLMGEVMDIVPDKAANRRTTATILGAVKTKGIIIGLVLVEIAILAISFHAYIFAAILGFGLFWLLLDVFLIFRNKEYTTGQMQFFALSSNLIGLASIIYVWWSGCLLESY